MSARAVLEVLASGPITTVQDLGRPGHAHLGVPLSGAADRSAHRLANRLVGNPESAATLEVTFGGLRLQAVGDVFAVVTGASCPVTVDDTPVGHGAAFAVRDGQVIGLGRPSSGLRSYLAVRGGIDVDPVLGSRATDTLSGLGPPPLTVGQRLPVGAATTAWPAATESFGDVGAGSGPAILTVSPGPRWAALIDPTALTTGTWVVNASSDRVGVRLDRVPDTDTDTDMAPLSIHAPDTDRRSEGVALGSVQVPPDGQPVVFGPDHPVTGGYPVVAVLTAESLDMAAQLVPGRRVRIAGSVRPLTRD